jgi:ubiquinol-cytochrome c reductase cytochrome c1 subunit
MFVMTLATSVHASTAGPAWDKAPDKIKDMAALQSGAKTFVNYCLNCHSAAFMRYNRLQDIGLTPEQIKDNLLVTNAKLGETMIAAIDPKQAKAWFGVNPPDLTVIARSRAGAGGTGADYLYSYMRGFYQDETKPTGWNNHVFPNVAMPHVLWELQSTLTPAQYDQTVGDLVNFLQWMAEPAQTTRKNIGIWVLVFLAGLTFLTWKLNAAYWKDVK